MQLIAHTYLTDNMRIFTVSHFLLTAAYDFDFMTMQPWQIASKVPLT